MKLAHRYRYLITAAALIAAVTIFPAMRASASSVPFTDPAAGGFIGLCNRAGQLVTSGNLDDIPFVWTAVSSTPAPKGFAHGKATLYAYQPIQGLPPTDWSGMQLTGSSAYSNPSYPSVQATNGDYPLLSFTQAYPPRWDGLVQLRVYFSAPNTPDDFSQYPATVLRVSGNKWRVVSGGKVGCDLGKSASDESQMLSKAELAKLATPQSLAVSTGGQASRPSTPPSSAKASGTAGTSGHKSGSTPSTTAASPHGGQGDRPSSGGRVQSAAGGLASSGHNGTGGLSGGAIAGIVLGGVAVLAAGITSFLWRRRRVRLNA